MIRHLGPLTYLGRVGHQLHYVHVNHLLESGYVPDLVKSDGEIVGEATPAVMTGDESQGANESISREDIDRRRGVVTGDQANISRNDVIKHISVVTCDSADGASLSHDSSQGTRQLDI